MCSCACAITVVQLDSVFQCFSIITFTTICRQQTASKLQKEDAFLPVLSWLFWFFLWPYFILIFKSSSFHYSSVLSVALPHFCCISPLVDRNLASLWIQFLASFPQFERCLAAFETQLLSVLGRNGACVLPSILAEFCLFLN